MFAVVTPGEDCTWKLFYGTDFHSHLGTEFGGMAVKGHEFVRRIHRISWSQFKTEFSPDLHLFSGEMGIGVISPRDEQPLMISPVNPALGLFTIATFGYIENAEDLVKELVDRGVVFKEEKLDGEKTINHTQLAGMIIGLEETFLDGIESLFLKMKGSLSILILNHDSIYAARSEFGQTPLYLAEKNGDKGKSWAVTMETSALSNLGYKQVKIFLPGETMKLDLNGPNGLRVGDDVEQLCTFFPIYTGFPSSEYNGISAETYRERMGAIHARHDLEAGIFPQMVTGIADSGTAYAVGYAHETIKIAREGMLLCLNRGITEGWSKTRLLEEVELLMEHIVPYRRPLVKYTPGWGRSYTPPRQIDRDKIARMKLLPIRDVIREAVDLLLTEDSIVRNTQLKMYLQQLRHILVDLWGFEKMPRLHVRPGCPPLAWPCKYLFATRDKMELAARKALVALLSRAPTDQEMTRYLDPDSRRYTEMVDYIRQDLGVDTLSYPTEDEMIACTGVEKKRLCTYCWNGNFSLNS